MKKLSVVIVNYNVCYFLEQTLLTVRQAARGLDVEVFVVDNASSDESVATVRTRFPEVRLIANPENVGFSKANNQAIGQATGQYILLLNPDTVVEEDTFRTCCAFMDAHPDAGGLGVRMVDGKGHFLPESKRGLPTPWVAFYKIFGLAALFPRSPRFGRYHLGFLDEHQTHSVEVLSGAFMLMRKSVLDQVGLLDEDYFMYGEDIDLSYRITQGGFRNYYLPTARILHYKGESTKRSSVSYVFTFYRAMIIFARKHFSGQHAGVFSVLIHLAIYLRAAGSVLARWGRRLAWPLADAALIWVGMFFLKSYWEVNHKRVPNFYPPDFMQLVVPAYILVWLMSVYFSGGYDRPRKAGRVVQGAVVGTLIIAAISNFLNDYRFSRALILLGGAWTTAVLVASRWAINFVHHGHFHLGGRPHYRVLVVGHADEATRAAGLLQRLRPLADVLGRVSPAAEATAEAASLGSLAELETLTQLYEADEVVFCARDLTMATALDWMERLRHAPVSFKMVPAGSDYLIGSDSKNAQGDLYTLQARLAIAQPGHRRQKRLLDLILSTGLLLLLPLWAWRWPQWVPTVGQVLTGRLSWVGFAHPGADNLPRLRPGVLTPGSGLPVANASTARRLDWLYAKDYRVGQDVAILWRTLRRRRPAH